MKQTLIISTESEMSRNYLWIELLRQDPNSFLYLPTDKHSLSEGLGNFPDIQSRVFGGWIFKPRKSSPTARFDAELAKIVKRNHIERIHVVGEPWGFPVLQSLKLSNDVYVHGAENIYTQGNRLKDRTRQRVTKWTLSKVRGFLGWHQLAVDAAKESGLPTSTPSIALPGQLPNPEVFRSLRDNRFHHTDVLRVITVGRLVPEKGVDILLRGLSTHGSGVQLTVVGQGPEEIKLKMLAQDLGVETTFLGWLDQRQLAMQLNRSHVMAACSRHTAEVQEQFGLAVLEGLLAGLPVIASSVGSLPDLIGNSGLIFEDGNSEALSKCITNLLDDKDQIERLSKLALDRALSYSPEIVSRKIIGFWNASDLSRC